MARGAGRQSPVVERTNSFTASLKKLLLVQTPSAFRLRQSKIKFNCKRGISCASVTAATSSRFQRNRNDVVSRGAQLADRTRCAIFHTETAQNISYKFQIAEDRKDPDAETFWNSREISRLPRNRVELERLAGRQVFAEHLSNRAEWNS